MIFLGKHILQIEKALERTGPFGWRRARPDHDAKELNAYSSAWRVDLPVSQLEHPNVDHVFLCIDSDFPLSDPVVIAPQAIAPSAPKWPHVEFSGVLCLTTTQFSAPPSQRILTALQNALDVLSMDVRKRESEFRREFISYWFQEVSSTAPHGYSLLSSQPKDRDIYFYWTRDGKIIFAENEDSLSIWLKNSSITNQKSFARTRFVWLDSPLIPDKFPKKGLDILTLAGSENIARHIRPGNDLPVLLGSLINSRHVYAGTILHGANKQFVQKGFRPNKTPPSKVLLRSYAGRDISAILTDRLDPGWIHGRDTSTHIDTLLSSSVVIVGCGAIGGYLAEGLAQAGVGNLTLVDSDELKPGNLGRHVLGSQYIGRSKANSLATHIRERFPCINSVRAYPRKFQQLNSAILNDFASCTLFVLAGVDLKAELACDKWVSSLASSPFRVWTWTEEFALAGHAVGLIGKEPLTDLLDCDGRFKYRLTKGWQKSQTLIEEAGCGTSFQPYDAVDMMNTVLMAQRLIIDLLLGKATKSTRRSWLGNRDCVRQRGGELSEEFDRSYSEISKALKR